MAPREPELYVVPDLVAPPTLEFENDGLAEFLIVNDDNVPMDVVNINAEERLDIVMPNVIVPDSEDELLNFNVSENSDSDNSNSSSSDNSEHDSVDSLLDDLGYKELIERFVGFNEERINNITMREEEEGYIQEEEEADENIDNEEEVQNEVDENMSDAETIEFCNDHVHQDPDFSSDEEENYSLEKGVHQEDLLQRIISLKKQFFRGLISFVRGRRNVEIKRLRRELNRMRNKRFDFVAANPEEKIKRTGDMPKRNVDFCFGCTKKYWCTRIRRWRRCPECGFWLCPECADKPNHC